jgi:FixJ family two-component response regulator
MLRRVLQLAEYEVATFASGPEFLASLAARVPACVILDVHMPRLSGLDVQAKLQAMHTDVPVIFITASDDPVLDQIVQEARGVALLRKPFRSDDLLGVVSAILQPKSCSGE